MTSYWLAKLFPGRRPARKIAPTRRLNMESMEDRCTPATLDITGGALTFMDSGTETNNLTVSVGGGVYSFNDASTNITLLSGAVSAGWKGSGTRTVSGPATPVTSITVNAGGGTNVVNLRSILGGDATTVNAGGGTVNISSNSPVNSGNLLGIGDNVAVTSAASLWVADASASSGNASVMISAGSITGLAGTADGQTISYSSVTNSG